jgi:serine-type D-Ala-D-Ala carboxypeptidase (penicillin-binding protein 5/6)
MFRSFLASLALTALASAQCLAQTSAAPVPAAPIAIPTAPQVDARAYILVDYRTDKILASKDAVARMEPASLTKLMTAYIVFQELAAGKLKLDQEVTVSEHAWRSEGSRTFIELGKPVSVQDLILGMIVQSGNDATIALAERIAGTEETFAQMMNANAKRLGMVGSHFENSSGLPSPQHYTTARDLSLLANAMIREYPQYYKWFSVHEFEHNGIKQQNRNGLLEKDPTVDGLKTGHTDSAGFCLVTSSLRDGMRLVSVVMGSTSMKARENASAALLNYGFTFYETKLAVKGGTVLATARVWKGKSPSVDLGIKEDLYVTLPRGAGDTIRTDTDVPPRLIAPIAAEINLGTLRVSAGNQTLETKPMHPLKAVEGGGWWRRLIDTIRLWFVK